MSLFPVLGAAEVSGELRALADRLPPTVHLGTSSWSFPGWTGIVWDRGASKTELSREGLAAYSQHPLLRGVGLDRTYYATMSVDELRQHAGQVPQGFRFLVKAHEACSVARWPDRPRYGLKAGAPNERFLDAAWATDEVVGPTVEGLGQKLGALLFQLPPQDVRAMGGPGRFAERLDRFLDALPDGPLYAVELRNRELFTPEYAQALVSNAASHGYTVHPRAPSLSEQIRMVKGGARHGLVARWCLRPNFDYQSAKGTFEPFDELVSLDEEALDALAHLIALAAKRGLPVLCSVNNKAEGSAPLSVFRLARAVLDEL